MKANEAPEKLYIWFGHPYTVDYTKLSERQFEEQVEYTRTDAFIKKAVSFIRNCTTYDDLGYKTKCVNIEKFINYMKEE